MSMQTSYPIFESGQVLTSRHLNDLVDYLEEQERLSRRDLIGIGIVCGLEVTADAGGSLVNMSAGVGLTSQGYLVTLPAATYDRYRSYELPKPELEEAPDDGQGTIGYSFFLNSSATQIDLWELFPQGAQVPLGEEPLLAFADPFLQDKVALIFLERKDESLRNCDIDDCNDRGLEREFTPRLLLALASDATAMVAREAAFSDGPIQAVDHPSFDLPDLRIDKINLNASRVTTYPTLLSRYLAFNGQRLAVLRAELNKGYAAYRYLLADLYPPDRFPNGPFGNPGYFERILTLQESNLALAPYVYDYLVDVIDSQNEFQQAASRLVAECSPSQERFPQHLLLGRAEPAAVVTPVQLNGPDEERNFDPLALSAGPMPPLRPADVRHHFVPSMLFDRQDERLQQVRSLHYRTYLLAYRFQLRGLGAGGLRITPNRSAGAPLSARSIPFYYALHPQASQDDLARNWSFDDTTANRLERLYAYNYLSRKFIPRLRSVGNTLNVIRPTIRLDPLRSRMDGHDFYRVEGLAGWPLGTTLRSLLNEKHRLDLPFTVQPVYCGFTQPGEANTEFVGLETSSLTQAGRAMRGLLQCQYEDLDLFFKVQVGSLFYYLHTMVSLLAKANTTNLVTHTVLQGGSSAPPSAAAPGGVAPPAAVAFPGSDGIIGTVNTSFLNIKLDQPAAEVSLKDLRATTYNKGLLTGKMTVDPAPAASVGGFFDKVNSQTSRMNLFDRTQGLAADLVPGFDVGIIVDRVYPFVSLLDKTEDLINIVRSPTIADFDFAGFTATYQAFVNAFDAYQAYYARQQVDPASELGQLNARLQPIYLAVAAAGPRATLGRMAAELQARYNEIFSGLVLPEFARRHPGLDHRGGVPAGGTLVLLYTQRANMLKVFNAYLPVFQELGLKTREGNGFPGVDVQASLPEELMSSGLAGAPQHELDQFVVLADFCLPYFLGDAECSELEKYLP